MAEQRRKVSFWATEKTKKPVIVRFRRSDGSITKFRATEIITKPRKVTFYVKKKRYR